MKILKFLIILIFFYSLNILSVKSSSQNEITKNLRCLICQGQSVYDSQSDFALSMKILIKNKIDEGKNDEEIYNFLKIKFGEWIVYDPEIKKNTILLWVLPLFLFVFGAILIIRKVSIK